LPVRPLDRLYAEPAREYIEKAGGAVRRGSPAKVRLVGGNAASVRCGAETWVPSSVVAAVPWLALPELFEGEVAPLEPILVNARNTAASPIATVNLWLDRPVLDEPFVGLPGRAMQWVFDKRMVVGDSASHLSLVSSGAADLLGRSNPELIAAAHESLIEALPAARAAHLRRATVIREPHATFSLAPNQPPRPGSPTPVRRLYLAGDWIDTGLPATIESAVRSGHRAADLAASS
jgi:hypothetical protein